MTVSAAPYVQLEQEPLTPQLQGCHGVLFVLDHDALLQLLTIKHQGQSLIFTDDFVLAWRRYVLFQENNLPQASLSFLLRYEGVNVKKTLLGLDGEVFCQVAQDLFLAPSLYHQLAEVQSWLMGQLLAQLPWRGSGRLLTLVAWALAIACVLGSIALSWSTIKAQPLLWLGAFIALCLLGWGYQRLLWHFRPRLRRWLLAQILYGGLAGRYGLRSLGLRWLHHL
ncbi:hypothetical protein FLX56_15130 [Synechococcus moorigangaii CMS01]|nr:hypothetical protein [Synechococcus moorigangaii CMS01]